MDPVALEKYINEYGRDVYSFCMYLTRNKDDADDLYQQTFLTAYEKNSIDENKNPKSYLITISVNIWNNQKRKILWRRNKADIIHFHDEALNRIEDDKDSVEEEVIRKEDQLRVRRFVDALPDRYKLVILMFYMENMSIDEIASALKVPNGTVKSRLHKAKQVLKEKMAYE